MIVNGRRGTNFGAAQIDELEHAGERHYPKLMQSPNATQQVYKLIADGEWADRFGSIAEIMDEWLQNSHLPLLTARFIKK